MTVLVVPPAIKDPRPLYRNSRWERFADAEIYDLQVGLLSRESGVTRTSLALHEEIGTELARRGY